VKKLIVTAVIIGFSVLGFVYKDNIAEKVLLTRNPLLNYKELPEFPKIKAEHFMPAINYVLNNYNKVLWNKVLTEKEPTWNNTVLPLEEASNKIDKVLNVIAHLNGVNNVEAIRKAYEQILPVITAFSAEIMQNEQLYKAYLFLRKSKEFHSYNQTQKMIIKHAIRDFKLAGVNLSKDKREHLKQIHQQLSKLGNQFSQNILDATQAWEYHVTEENKTILDGLPEHTILLAKEKAAQKNQSGWILTLDVPSYSAVMDFAKDSKLRETFYTAYNTRASDQGPMAGKWDNTKIINEILKLKQELAVLLGYHNYAEYSLVPKMAKNPGIALSFVEDLVNHFKPYAERELAELVKFAQEKYGVQTLNAWDLAYYSELYQQEHYKISQEQLRPYFPEQQVLSGLFSLAERLFTIKIQEVTNIPKWHDTVKLFAVTDAKGNLKGKFYIDLYTRNFKRAGAWEDSLVSRFRQQDGTVQNPIAFLVTNFTPPTNGKPALLSHEEVGILFHEFGHTLHHILTQVDYPSVAGNHGVAWDAVELPSQFMENWCWEWDVVKNLSQHYQTRKKLSKAKFDKLLAIKNFHSGLFMIRQLEFALFDLKLHINTETDRGKSTQRILDEVRQRVAVFSVPAFNRFQNSFEHIFNGGYDAGYFSYTWAEVLSSDAFEKFKENGTFNKEVGARFLHTILEQGGSREAMDLFVEFRGRKPTVDAMLKHRGIK
jgi:oligopeptidase A